MSLNNIHFLGSEHAETPAAIKKLKLMYGHAELDTADVIVALGGDGFMLRVLHRIVDSGLPVYGMRMGRIGFLMNGYQDGKLLERLEQSSSVRLNPLRMTATTADGSEHEALAINEVSLLRQSNQAAHLRLSINASVKIDELVADGILVSTAAGSTAYNFSARGPILPLGTGALAVTPISPFRPRRWHGAVLPSEASVEIDILQAERRPVSATADYIEFRDVIRVKVVEDAATVLTLMFDQDHSLEERILNEQFR
ncbi:MAG: NAD kinase [Xanthomonadales bacterium]|nr:NAD kinase [Xanthomonadales bacterium]